MATGSRKSAAQWRVLVQEWKKSGQPRDVFADAHGVVGKTLGWWASELSRRSRACTSKGKGGAASAVFLPVRVVSEPPGAATAVTPAQVEVVLGAGRVLRVPVGADARWLASVVSALEESARC